MNQRNVDALVEILSGAGSDGTTRDLAEWLSHYVLVPSALTEGECQRIFTAARDGDGQFEWDYVGGMKEEMEDIARGDE